MVQEGTVPPTEHLDVHIETDHESDTELALSSKGGPVERIPVSGRSPHDRSSLLKGPEGLRISRPTLKERVERGLLSGKLDIRTHCPESK